ncbi:CHAT domain-containing protein [Actinomadura kijaniata]|uniref:Tetratricopeptide (TPR) repeat protein n=1 Tax=Actinomadura namibiensis TaxID=182080 RepID=A0A7W3LPB6_ACTNM|nr:CHAT domain-containing protein [Actinomadura namibiensis]MBA8951800.1 tetratricopeptide (TPR) repeat protein [Actinomadura namibiensis]
MNLAELQREGVAAAERGRLTEGLGLLRTALSVAAERGPREVARVRVHLVGLLAARGEVTAALVEASGVGEELPSADADRLTANLACALARAGRFGEARETAERVLSRIRRSDDPASLAGLLTTLGVSRAMQGALCGAEPALREAVEVATRADLTYQTAIARGALAFVVARRGDLPQALELFALAEPGLVGERLTQCRLERAETLLMAGLVDEARALLAATLNEAAEQGHDCDLADGLLLLAHAELSDNDPERAAATAERARATFAAQERAGWMLLAEHVLLRARWTAGERSPVFLSSATATADRLERGGWTEAAAEARIMAARTALDLGRPAGHLLEQVSRFRVRGPAALRAAAWHALALERRSRDDLNGAVAAVWSGLRVVEDHAEVFAALELRARAADLATELADLGLSLARSARELLSLEERRRTLLRRPHEPGPPRDSDRAAALARLRALSRSRTATTADGEPAPDLFRRLNALEGEIRTERYRRPAPRAEPSTRAGTPEVAAALGERVLVELIRVGADLHAVTIRDGRPRRHRLGPFNDIARAASLTRAAVRRAAEQEDLRTETGLSITCTDLNDRILQPLQAEVTDRELVLVPTGPLHTVPWAALPSLTGRPFTVAPSATAWFHAVRRQREPGHVLLASGPDLTHAGREVDALRHHYPNARVLQGRNADAETVRDALNGASLAHVAAHGEFRDGNALFSHLRLSDGPLFVHDLEEVERLPRTVVLSACDIGRSEAGDAAIGMVGALLARGTATVVASVTPIRDEEAPALMATFHRALAEGRSPAQALASAPRPPGVAGFLCFGAG